tara:strand:+ start:2741 stop:3559 length:819 start_codon:yes stop_codon:yes gene_type:complete
MSELGNYGELFERIGLTKVERGQPRDAETNELLAKPEILMEGEHWGHIITKTTDYIRGCIHVGAWNCAELGDYVQLFGENVHWVEANRNSYWLTSRPRANAYGQKVYNFAAYDIDNEEIELLIPSRGDCSTLVRSQKEEFQPTEVAKINTKKLDTFIKENNIDMSTVDVLNIDAEGSEFKILKGIEENLKFINFVIIEVSIDPDRFPGTPLFEEIKAYLEKRGFLLVAVSNFGAQGWGDAFFARKTVEIPKSFVKRKIIRKRYWELVAKNGY